jgi:hypothetical protein
MKAPTDLEDHGYIWGISMETNLVKRRETSKGNYEVISVML